MIPDIRLLNDSSNHKIATFQVEKYLLRKTTLNRNLIIRSVIKAVFTQNHNSINGDQAMLGCQNASKLCQISGNIHICWQNF